MIIIVVFIVILRLRKVYSDFPKGKVREYTSVDDAAISSG